MRAVSQWAHGYRNRCVSQQRIARALDRQYQRRCYAARARSVLQQCRGRVDLRGKHSSLLIGPAVDLQMQARSAIVLKDSVAGIGMKAPWNPVHARSSNIGMQPDWRLLNHTSRKRTRLRLQEESRLILSPNCMVAPGAYLSIWPGQTLRMGTNCYIGHNTFISTKCSLYIGDNSLISFDCHIMDYDGHPINKNDRSVSEDDYYGGVSGAITLEDDVLVGFGVTILKGVTIGQGSWIASHSVVTKDVPKHSIVAGNPARVICENVQWER